MELDWIEDFLVLAETGVFSKAAARRNVTQPAFTRRIRKLEYAIGAPLFDRSVHPVVLTRAGTEFRPMAVDMLRTLSAAKTRLRGLQGGTEVVTIAALQALATAVLPELLARARRAPPVKVLADDFAGCVEALLTGSADMLLSYTHPSVITAELADGFEVIAVGADVMIAVSGVEAGRALHALSDAEVPWLRYSDESFLGKVAARIVTRSDLSDRLVPRYQNSMADGLRTAARAGLGVAWVPERSAHEDLARGRLIRISTLDTEEPIGIAMLRDAAPRARPMERLWADLRRSADG